MKSLLKQRKSFEILEITSTDDSDSSMDENPRLLVDAVRNF